MVDETEFRKYVARSGVRGERKERKANRSRYMDPTRRAMIVFGSAPPERKQPLQWSATNLGGRVHRALLVCV